MLGAQAAQLLGIDRVFPGLRVWLGGMWFYVTGILTSAALAPEIDSSVLVGFPAAGTYLGLDGHPTTIYVRTVTSQTAAVNPGPRGDRKPTRSPNEVDVQPALRSPHCPGRMPRGHLNGLFLGLGAVSLLVGAVGVANIMIISVLERRSEIGLRRALGATKGNIRTQFLSEAILLALLGGLAGVTLGILATAVYAHTKHWATVIPTLAWAGGLGAAFAIGAVAGLLPAIRAARLAPIDRLLRHRSGQIRRASRSRSTLFLAALGSVVLLAGCGGGAKSPAVASLGTPPSSGGSASSSSSLCPRQGTAGTGRACRRRWSTGRRRGRFYCLHALARGAELPRPGLPRHAHHHRLRRRSIRARRCLQRAEGDYQRLLPAAKPLSQVRQQEMQRRLLAFAACMRSHGFPHYPDPTFGPGGMVSQAIGRNDGIDPRSPFYQTAQKRMPGEPRQRRLNRPPPVPTC